MEPEVFLDPQDFLRELYERDIRYLLVGRQACVLLGAPLLSEDFDFYISPDLETLKSLLSLGRDLGLEVSVKKPEKKPVFSLLCDNLKLDFFRCREYSTKTGETFTFDEIFDRKLAIPVGDFAVYIPAIRDLIRTKLIRNLPKDQEDLKYLQVLLERSESG